MNYESSPFQDYASISVDDLKDQSNSLSNLVAEEQRPLRVLMIVMYLSPSAAFFS